MKFLRFAAFTFALMGVAVNANAQLPSLSSFIDGEAGITGGSELLLFTLYGKQGAGGTNGGNTNDYFPEHENAAGGRYWLGYEMEDGLGMRARFFHWSDQQIYTGSLREQTFQTFDLEATLDRSLYSFDFVGFTGLRWGSVELDGSDFGGTSDDYNFDGLGLTVGFEARRSLLGNISLVGGTRYSVLYGDNKFGNGSDGLGNTFLDVFEFQLGTEWSKNLGRNSRLFAKVAWEQQVYGTDSYMPGNIDPETLGEVSLAGPVFSIGFDR